MQPQPAPLLEEEEAEEGERERDCIVMGVFLSLVCIDEEIGKTVSYNYELHGDGLGYVRCPVLREEAHYKSCLRVACFMYLSRGGNTVVTRRHDSKTTRISRVRVEKNWWRVVFGLEKVDTKIFVLFSGWTRKLRVNFVSRVVSNSGQVRVSFVSNFVSISCQFRVNFRVKFRVHFGSISGQFRVHLVSISCPYSCHFRV